jgi:C1A family cysteine protease
VDFKGQGFRPEPENPRHWGFEEMLRPVMAPPNSYGDVDLRLWATPVLDQGRTNSCVAHAVVSALGLKLTQQSGDSPVSLSRMAVYYLGRELMDPPECQVDQGLYISFAFDVLRRFGVPPESAWPWDETKLHTPPSWKAMRKAYEHKIRAYYKILSGGPDRVSAVVECLQAGYPVVFGTTTGMNWHLYKKGDVLTLPDTVRGRHATVLVGFQDGKFIGQNSWGPDWGMDGFYWMSPEVIAATESRDFWVAQGGFEPLVAQGAGLI